MRHKDPQKNPDNGYKNREAKNGVVFVVSVSEGKNRILLASHALNRHLPSPSLLSSFPFFFSHKKKKGKKEGRRKEMGIEKVPDVVTSCL